MRKILLASAALLGAGTGGAFAQFTPTTPPTPGTTYNQSQGQYAAPWFGAPSAQNYNNMFGSTFNGAKVAVLGATPSPGTVVIRLNGKVYAEVDSNWGTVLHTAPGTFGSAGYKLNPVGIDSFFRLYPGIDGMATNGLRYGAAVEIRENFEGGDTFGTPAAVPATAATGTAGFSSTAASGTNSSASGNSSAETLFVRRAFVYLGSDQTGIFRLGQQDGLPGIYDALGMFTIGIWDGGVGNLNNGCAQAVTPSQYLISWPFLSGNGTEYGDNKIVYLSPSFYGVDVGFEYGPNEGNSFNQSTTSSPYQSGTCTVASANCINITSGQDGSRWINRWGFGTRFIEQFGPLNVQGYGVYIVSGHENNTATGGQLVAGPKNIGAAAGNLLYDGQNFGNLGLLATYMGITANADVTVGRTDGSNALDPRGGAPMAAELFGLSYFYGAWSFGADAAIIDSQGAAQLTHTSQRHEFATAIGGAYRIAPGIVLCLEYQYEQKHQGDFRASCSRPS
jgi:predicted porin